VLWAQRSSTSEPEKNYIYLTISVPDVPKSSLKLDLKPTHLTFTGTSETKKTTYHLDLEFYEEIDVENSKTNHSAKDIEMILRKKELKEEYWPRLLKDKAKVHFLRTDFDKVCTHTLLGRKCKADKVQWVDQDEQNAAPEDDYMNNFGGGMGEDGGFGGIDFSKLGAGAGAGDEGAAMEGAEEGEEDEDEEMPELEEEEGEGEKAEAGESSKAAPKVQEVK
jgi:hypothetical protein